MTSWSRRRQDADAEWRMVREEAEQVACPSCYAMAGEHCRNTITGGATRFPAHPLRIREARDASAPSPPAGGGTSG